MTPPLPGLAAPSIPEWGVLLLALLTVLAIILAYVANELRKVNASVEAVLSSTLGRTITSL